MRFEDEYRKFKKYNPGIIGYRNKRWIMLFVKWFFLDALLVLLTYVMFDDNPVTTALIAVLAVLTVPFVTLKPQRYFRKQWIGKIERIEYLTRQMPRDNNFFSRSYMVQVERIVCHSHGKRSFELDQKYEMTYHVGDTVMSIAGLDYPINLTPHGDVVCPKCGGILREENEECPGYCDMVRVVIPPKEDDERNYDYE